MSPSLTPLCLQRSSLRAGLSFKISKQILCFRFYGGVTSSPHPFFAFGLRLSDTFYPWVLSCFPCSCGKYFFLMKTLQWVSGATFFVSVPFFSSSSFSLTPCTFSRLSCRVSRFTYPSLLSDKPEVCVAQCYPRSCSSFLLGRWIYQDFEVWNDISFELLKFSNI